MRPGVLYRVRMPNPVRSSHWIREVGRRLAVTREALDLTQQQLAEEIGVSRGALGNWEQGSRLPDPAAMARLVQRYRVSLDWLYLGDPSNLPHHLAAKLLGPQSDRSARTERDAI